MESGEPLRLGVVDQAPVREGGSAGDALREAILLAQRVEALGYERYWVAEHHNLPSLAATSPEILIGQIAAATSRLRVGSGGVMLTHYSALKVAENFRLLESLFPGRIDLGLGRAPGGDRRTAQALAYPAPVKDVREYPQQVDDLIGFLADDLDAAHPFAGIRAGPTPTGVPEVWLLGSGVDSALIAAERGQPFSFAHFFGTAIEEGPAIVETYRKRYRPSQRFPEPRVHVGLGVLCAETEEEVEYLAASMRLSRINMARGIHRGIVAPDEALAHEFTPEEVAYLERSSRAAIQGTPQQVRMRIDEVARAFGTRELGIVTICYDFAARVRSYELVAEVCGLRPSHVATSPPND
jgi:luciferase family oxidoreductase group 1